MTTSFDSGTAGAGITLSNSDTTATYDASSGSDVGVKCFAVDAHDSGLYYFEFAMDVSTIDTGDLFGLKRNMFGFVASDETTLDGSQGIKVSANGWTCENGEQLGSIGSSLTTGMVGAIAVNLDSKLWWARRVGGSWNNVFLCDPATGANGNAMPANLLGLIIPFCAFQSDVEGQITINTGGSAFVGTAPTGFLPWGPTDAPAQDFTDGDSDALSWDASGFLPPANPFEVAFSDGSSDGLTIVFGPPVVQVTLVMTGR